MTAGLSLLFATLIGIFITPDGIVVGADTAISSRAGQSSRAIQKSKAAACVIHGNDDAQCDISASKL